MKTKEIPEHNIERLHAITTFLREFRLSNGYTQNEISDAANLSRNTVVRLESNCPENLSLLTIFEIIDVMEIGLNDLFNDIE